MRISLITIALNSGQTIEDTLQSVLTQSYKDYEYIVVDGGSTDGTMDTVKRYEPLFEGRMRWVSEPDTGLYDGLNKGIRMATGDVVGLLHSDDFFHRTDILAQVNAVFEEDRGIQSVYGDVRYVMPDNLHRTVRYFSSRHWCPWLFRFGYILPHPSYYTYRANFEQYGYYKTDYLLSADYDLLIRHLYVHRLKAQYLPLDFVTMRIGGKSTSGLRSTQQLNREIVRACRENGIRTCLPLLYCRYFVKVFQFVVKR